MEKRSTVNQPEWRKATRWLVSQASELSGEPDQVYTAISPALVRAVDGGRYVPILIQHLLEAANQHNPTKRPMTAEQAFG
jgi:hypothetical protein